MSVHEPPQFTPAQILDAGHRAETEGRGDFALQFYRHLVDHYPGSQEAGAAQHGIARLGSAQAVNANGGRPLPTGQSGSAQAPLFEPHRYQTPPADHYMAPGQRMHSVPARAEQRYLEPPVPVSDYLTARILARLVTWLGGLVMLAGIALVPIAVLSPRSLAGVPMVATLVSESVYGAGIIVAGLVQIILGQLVRAVLDQANAARDLAALTRARAEGQSERSVRPARR